MIQRPTVVPVGSRFLVIVQIVQVLRELFFDELILVSCGFFQCLPRPHSPALSASRLPSFLDLQRLL